MGLSVSVLHERETFRTVSGAKEVRVVIGADALRACPFTAGDVGADLLRVDTKLGLGARIENTANDASNYSSEPAL